jgi:hypothetical protein
MTDHEPLMLGDEVAELKARLLASASTWSSSADRTA